jgi:uncharacterized protein YueI
VLFESLGLCSHITFDDEYAFLNIYDVDDSSVLSFKTRIVSADLKGATPIQCLGAQHTYIRRYLWVLAMEISENDVVDVGDNKKTELQNKQQEQKPAEKLWLKLNTDDFTKAKFYYDSAENKAEAQAKIYSKYNIEPNVLAALKANQAA